MVKDLDETDNTTGEKMTKITIEVKDDQAKMWAYFLQQKYNTTQTNLNKLAEMAILVEVAKSAQDILDISEGDLVKPRKMTIEKGKLIYDDTK